ncbi:MFS transporter (plasmid) [Paracoccus yeei]
MPTIRRISPICWPSSTIASPGADCPKAGPRASPVCARRRPVSRPWRRSPPICWALPGGCRGVDDGSAGGAWRAALPGLSPFHDRQRSVAAGPVGAAHGAGLADVADDAFRHLDRRAGLCRAGADGVAVAADRRAGGSLALSAGHAGGAAAAGRAGAGAVRPGAALAFIANALAALLFCAALHLLRDPPLARPPTPEPLGRMFREGLRYAFSHPGLRLMMGISVAAALLARSVPEILPGYAALFGHEAELFARMSAVVGAGAMLGGILVARGRSPRRLALMALTAAGALACIVILLALAPGRVPALALLFLLGTALVVSAVSNLSVIQMTADPSRRGRVLSLHTMIFRGGPAAGALAIGGLSDLVGLRLVLAFSGGLCLILALWCASRRQPGLASLLDEP